MAILGTVVRDIRRYRDLARLWPMVENTLA